MCSTCRRTFEPGEKPCSCPSELLPWLLRVAEDGTSTYQSKWERDLGFFSGSSVTAPAPSPEKDTD